jgi:3-oxoacyl-[acyl-carrier protein] reductase
MTSRGWGRIVNISSINGQKGQIGQTNYTTTKAGMHGFTMSLAQEVAARGVTVNCVAPGFIASPMTDALTDDQKAAILTKIPAGDLGSGDDIAAAVVYLASSEAHYVTGQTVHVNGGMAMI